MGQTVRALSFTLHKTDDSKWKIFVRACGVRMSKASQKSFLKIANFRKICQRVFEKNRFCEVGLYMAQKGSVVQPIILI